MVNFIHILGFVIFLLFTKVTYAQNVKTEKSIASQKLIKILVEQNIRELGNGLKIVQCSTNLEKYRLNNNDSIFDEFDMPICLIENDYSNIYLIKPELLNGLTHREYKRFVNINSENGYLEFRTPLFTKDGKFAVVEIFFANKGGFRVSDAHIFELIDNKWEEIEFLRLEKYTW